MLKVCDLSSNNSVAQQNTAINENDAVIVKCTEGSSYVNPYYKSNVISAFAKGKCIGLYHYARPEKNSVEIEVWNFLKNAAPYIGRVILVLDWEGKALNVSQKWARDWLDMVYNITGVRPLLYCSEAYLKKVGPFVVPGNYGLWVAKYSKKSPVISPWTVKALWQYTSMPYDKSNFYGDIHTWNAYAQRSI